MKRVNPFLLTRTLNVCHRQFPTSISKLYSYRAPKRLLCTKKEKSDTDTTDTTDTVVAKVETKTSGNDTQTNDVKSFSSNSTAAAAPESSSSVTKKSPYRVKFSDPTPPPKHQRDVNSPYDTTSYSTYSKKFHPASPPSSSSAQPHIPPVHASRMWNYTASMNNSIKDIEQSLMKRIHESNQRRFRLIFFGSLGAVIWFFVAFGESIGAKVKSMTTGLALETLEDKAIKVQTEELARAVVQTVLNDAEVTAQAAAFLREASHAPETQEALLKLTLHVLQHPDSLKELSLLTKNVLAALSSDPEAIKHLANLFSEVFQDSELKQHLNVVASEICKSPEVMAAASELTAEVFREPIVQKAVNDILVEGSSNVMKNDEVSVQSRQFVAEVMGDDSLQREGGDALWNSIYHAVVPGAIRIAGFSIICMSLGLGGLMLSPY